MAEFNECATCNALTTPAGAKPHAADHAHTDKRIDALTRDNTAYRQEVASLKQQIAAYGRQLDAHPISMDPETITISAAPDFDPEDLADADEDNAYAGEPDEDGDQFQEATTILRDPDYPPAIDRPDEDDLDHRLANATGQVTPLS